ncbi:unnamed protein product [Mytilus edulis]|uniref:VLIG-type G domain-containing protein n=1 Tax=Mytilus edulis TaxID=6550 RepID=A0A8S3SA37_MYTED|nr:unnamed protein product [Mytilus edulis]
MQLIPVNSQTEKFDFILVLDTEGIHGIQAPDSNQKRNINEIELTTFVIGLSDAILVSMGEGRIAEQKNALEIVVQSLLKEFPDHDDMKRERMNLQNALDDVSKDIICQEKAVDLNGFKDIIDFDCNKNVWFLPLMRNTNADVKPQILYTVNVFTVLDSQFVENRRKDTKIKENVREKQKVVWKEFVKKKIINEQIAEQAQQLQTEKITDTLLEEKFNQVWEQRIETLKSQGVKIKVLIKDQITTLLQQEFSSDAEFVGQLGLPNSETYGSYSQLVGTIDVSRISTRDHLIVVSESDFPPEKCRNQTVQVANHIFQKIDTKLAELGSADIQFDLTYVHEILVIVVSYIAEHNRHLNNTYKFDLLPKFQALIMIHVVNYATEFFSRRIKVPCTPHTDDYKTTAWCYFKNIAKGETEDVIASGFLTLLLSKSLKNRFLNFYRWRHKEVSRNTFTWKANTYKKNFDRSGRKRRFHTV